MSRQRKEDSGEGDERERGHLSFSFTNLAMCPIFNKIFFDKIPFLSLINGVKSFFCPLIKKLGFTFSPL